MIDIAPARPPRPPLRHADGLSGHPGPAESPHDPVENARASTDLSFVDVPVVRATGVDREQRRTP